MQYRTFGNQTFSSLPPELAPKIVYAAGSLDGITPGTIVIDELGIQYKVGAMPLVAESPRLVYQITLTPLPQEATNV